MIEQMTQMEGQILLWIQNNLRYEPLDPLVKAITFLGNSGWFWIVLTLAMIGVPTILLRRMPADCGTAQLQEQREQLLRIRAVGHMCAYALLWSLVINNLILKPLVARERPYDQIPGLVSIVGREKDLSFPSGHTGASLAAALVMYRELPRRYGVPAVILAVLIALSRLYVGVHFPTDVLGGAVSAVLCSRIACLMGARIRAGREKT